MVALAFGNCPLGTDCLPPASSLTPHYDLILIYGKHDHPAVALLLVSKNILLVERIIISSHAAKRIHVFANSVCNAKQQLLGISFQVAACNQESGTWKPLPRFFCH